MSLRFGTVVIFCLFVVDKQSTKSVASVSVFSKGAAASSIISLVQIVLTPISGIQFAFSLIHLISTLFFYFYLTVLFPYSCLLLKSIKKTPTSLSLNIFLLERLHESVPSARNISMPPRFEVIMFPSLVFCCLTRREQQLHKTRLQKKICCG